MKHFTTHYVSLLFFRDFHNGTAGLASIGTICRRQQNSGFVTMLNYGQTRSIDESVLTFTHELGHSFGAKHDSDTEQDECMDKGYIMSEIFEDASTTIGN